MSTAAELLVIIVSSVLVIFLIIAIILAIYLIKLTSEIKKVAKTAEHTVSNLNSAVSGVAKLTSPLFVAEMVTRMVKKYAKSDNKKGKK